MHKLYKAKSILNTHKRIDGGWFWTKYSALPYSGCQWGCEYCYFRDEKYNPNSPKKEPDALGFEDAFSELIKVKEDSPTQLRKALLKKKPDLIRLGDYQPVENEYRYSRQMLEVCRDLGFPVLVVEKTPALARDLDVLKEISQKTYLNVGWSIITTKDDTLRKSLEKLAPPVGSRFAAMKKLSDEGIYTGTIFMPILPYIYDSEENIEAVIKKTKESGGQYVLEGGLSLYGFNKNYFLGMLTKTHGQLVEKYQTLYSDKNLLDEHTKRTHKLVKKYCEQYDLLHYIPRPVKFFPEHLQINKRIAGTFYLRARELQLTQESTQKEWAYRKAAWAIDDLEIDLQRVWQDEGVKGLMQVSGIGNSLAQQIAEHFSKEERLHA